MPASQALAPKSEDNIPGEEDLLIGLGGEGVQRVAERTGWNVVFPCVLRTGRCADGNSARHDGAAGQKSKSSHLHRSPRRHAASEKRLEKQGVTLRTHQIYFARSASMMDPSACRVA